MHWQDFWGTSLTQCWITYGRHTDWSHFSSSSWTNWWIKQYTREPEHCKYAWQHLKFRWTTFVFFFYNEWIIRGLHQMPPLHSTDRYQSYASLPNDTFCTYAECTVRQKKTLNWWTTFLAENFVVLFFGFSTVMSRGFRRSVRRPLSGDAVADCEGAS